MTRKIPLFAGLLILIFLPFAIGEYHLHLAIYICIYSMLALGFAVMWKMRLINVGQAAFWGIGAYASAILTTELGISFWLALPIAGIVAAAIAFLLYGLALRTTRLMYFTMGIFASLIIPEAIGGTEALGAWGGYLGIPPPAIGSMVFVSKAQFYYLALFLLLLTVLTFYALYSSRIGRAWTAIGASVPLAQAQGINLLGYQLAAAVIGSFFAGLAGSFFAAYQGVIVPTSFGFYNSLMVQLYCLVGGLGNFVAGPILGSAVMLVLPEYLRVVEEFQMIVYGVMLIVLVVFLPGGLLSILQYPRVGRLLGRIGNRISVLPVPGRSSGKR